MRFTPQHTLNQIKASFDAEPEEEEKRQKLVDEYLEFRDLMMSIDPTDEDESGDEQRSAGAATPGRKSPGAEGDGDNCILVDGVPHGAGDNVDMPGTPGATSSPKSAKLPYYYHKRERPVHQPRGRTPKLLQSTPKQVPPKKKAKKKRKKLDGSDDDSNEDPDFML